MSSKIARRVQSITGIVIYVPADIEIHTMKHRCSDCDVPLVMVNRLKLLGFREIFYTPGPNPSGEFSPIFEEIPQVLCLDCSKHFGVEFWDQEVEEIRREADRERQVFIDQFRKALVASTSQS